VAAPVDRFRTRSFRVYSDLPRLQAAALSEHADVVYDAMERVFVGFPDQSGTDPLLFLMETREGLDELMLDRLGVGAGGRSRFAITERGCGIGVWAGDLEQRAVERELRRVAFSMVYGTRLRGRTPEWVAYGLQEYFVRGWVVRRKFRLGIVERSDAMATRSVLMADGFAPLSAFVAEGGDGWMQASGVDADVASLQAWAVVHFLMEGESSRYRKRFLRYLELCVDGWDHSRAWAQVFGEGAVAIEHFEAAWGEWLAEIEPDPISVARDRMRLWAIGLEELHGRGEEVGSLEAMRARLDELGWSGTITLAGEDWALSARETEWFELPSGFDEATFRSGSPGEPQSITLGGLRGVRPTLRWERVTERNRNAGEEVGAWRPVIEF